MRKILLLIATLPMTVNAGPVMTLGDLAEMNKLVVGGAETHVQFYLIGYKEGFISLMTTFLADAGKDSDSSYRMYTVVNDCLRKEDTQLVTEAAFTAARINPDKPFQTWLIERYMTTCGDEIAAASYWIRMEDE